MAIPRENYGFSFHLKESKFSDIPHPDADPASPILPNRYTESFMYYARQQTAVACGRAWRVRRFTGRQTAAARKHSLCFLVQFLCNCHAHRRTFAKRRR